MFINVERFKTHILGFSIIYYLYWELIWLNKTANSILHWFTTLVSRRIGKLISFETPINCNLKVSLCYCVFCHDINEYAKTEYSDLMLYCM